MKYENQREYIDPETGVAGGYRFPWEETGTVRAEDLVIWTYARMQAHRYGQRGQLLRAEAEAAGYVGGGGSGDGVLTMERIGMLGTQIDGGSGVEGGLHPVAEQVDAIVSQMRADRRLLLVDIALAGGDPDWGREVTPRLWAADWDSVRKCANVERIQYVDPKTGQRRQVDFCSVAYDVERHADAVAFKREKYIRWMAALALVADWMNEQDISFRVLPPEGSPAPWIEAGVGPGVGLASALSPAMKRRMREMYEKGY